MDVFTFSGYRFEWTPKAKLIVRFRNPPFVTAPIKMDLYDYHSLRKGSTAIYHSKGNNHTVSL